VLRDPRLLILLFQDLDQAVERWTTDLARLEGLANGAASETVEQVDALRLDVRQARDLAEEGAQAADHAERQARQALNDAITARSHAAAAVEATTLVANTAASSLAGWTAGLNRANGLLARARVELPAARERLAAAEASYRAAQAALSQCQSTYRTDAQGHRIPNDCSSQASWASACHGAVGLRQAEVRRAEAELLRCQQLVTQCEIGTSRATRLYNDAWEALLQAEDASYAARLAYDEADTARLAAQRGRGIVARLASIAQTITTVVQDAAAQASAAQTRSRRLAQIAETQRDRQLRSRATLWQHEDRLRDFDNPDGLEGR
jgi:hypothetical protein